MRAVHLQHIQHIHDFRDPGPPLGGGVDVREGSVEGNMEKPKLNSVVARPVVPLRRRYYARCP